MYKRTKREKTYIVIYVDFIIRVSANNYLLHNSYKCRANHTNNLHRKLRAV